MSTNLVYPRLYSDSSGDSHFHSATIPTVLQNFAPPALPFEVSPLTTATQCGFLCLPTGWIGAMHPSPIRMWIFVLQGKMHFEASDGNSAQISPGSAVLLEGTAGLGHFSKVLGDKPSILAAVRLPEEHPKSESP